MQRAINLSRMKRANQRMLLDEIRKGPVSRAELAARLSLTRASVTQNVDQLIGEGLVRESGMAGAGVGRRSILLSLRAEACFAAGVNIRRGTIDLGWVNLAGETLAARSLETAGAPPEERLYQVRRMLEEMRQALGLAPERVLGAGVCAPGPLDAQRRMLINPPNFEAWHGAKIGEGLGMEMVLENNADALALEEKYYGLAQESPSAMIVQVDEGVGAGLLIAGRLYRGVRGMASELGHTSIEWNGRKCACGNTGCLEAYAAMPAILKEGRFPSWRAVADGAEAGDQAALDLMEREARYLSSALVSAMNLLDLERVILRGDIGYKSEPLAARIEELVLSRIITGPGSSGRRVLFTDTVSGVRTGAIALLNAYFTRI